MNINMYKGNGSQTGDFVPMDLNEKNVIELSQAIKDYGVHQAEIAFLVGQLEPVYRKGPSVCLKEEIATKYDNSAWTEKKEVYWMLMDMAVKAGVGAYSDAAGDNEICFSSDILPVRSPMHPAYRGWCNYQGHLWRYQGWDAFNKGNFEKALEFYEKAAKAKDGIALEMCSRIYYEGLGTDKNEDEAIRWLLMGTGNGNSDVEKIRPWLFYWAGNPKYKNDAFIFFQADAYRNMDLPAHLIEGRTGEVMCGIMNRFGIGTDKNSREALMWFRVAAEAGYADAQYYLGQMYEHGEGVTANAEEARKWYEKAEKQGMPEKLQSAGGDPALYCYQYDKKESWWLTPGNGCPIKTQI